MTRFGGEKTIVVGGSIANIRDSRYAHYVMAGANAGLPVAGH